MANGYKYQILLVDDDDKFRKNVREFLENRLRNCKYWEAVNGHEALLLVYEKKFDIVICDYDMPVMDGAEFIYKIRKWLRLEIPVILVSDAVLEQDFTKMGFDSFVNKRDMQQSLFNQVRKFIY